jgi:hypothetical protein
MTAARTLSAGAQGTQGARGGRQEPILLEVLLRERQWHRYGIFRVEYEKAAKALDRHLIGTVPSRAQLHRWIAGELRRLPYVDHCRVLEAMLPGHTAEELFSPAPPKPLFVQPDSPLEPAETHAMADVAAVFTSRSDFTSSIPSHRLFGEAEGVRAVGLSLNLICQQFSDRSLRTLIGGGGTLHCLFLDPTGEAMRAREREEGHPPGYLAALTRLNIELLQRLRDGLPAEARRRLTLATYDETIRFNIILIDGPSGRAGVVQPYLPTARGLDAPTLYLRPGTATTGGGLLLVFDRVFTELAERSHVV